MDTVPSLAVDDPFERDEKIEERAKRLHDKPERLAGIINHALKDSDAHVQLLLFIDQFEELFTLANAEHAAPFAAMLAGAANCECLRVVVTMRHDFSANAVEIADLAELLRNGFFALSAPRRDALRQMIERPAERAGLQLEAGLVERILDDTGDKSGNLALMAYALDELYKLSGDGHITHADYDKLGGVRGAIGTRAEQVYAALPGDDKDKAAWMQRVFHELVAVDERGTATRRHVPAGRIAEDDQDRVGAFVEARLLTTDASDDTPVLEVAHEALFRSWERLKDWIAEAQEDLILLRQVRTAAAEWHEKGRPEFLLWPQERLTLVYAMQERLKPELSEVERDFIEPEANRLLHELETLPEDATSHERRRDIGDRLSVIGDPRPGVGVINGLPNIVWLPIIAGGQTRIDSELIKVSSFYVARFPITFGQFQVFIESVDGPSQPQWWMNMPERDEPSQIKPQLTKVANNPRDSISWYQAVAYSRWLNSHLYGISIPSPEEEMWLQTGFHFKDKTGSLKREWTIGNNVHIRLPTEWEWQWAAFGGESGPDYPWGLFREGYINSVSAGLNRTVAVGMYPHASTACGALDMLGNVYEWCMNDFDRPYEFTPKSGSRKSLRGGSFNERDQNATSSYRTAYAPYDARVFLGFRLVIATTLE